MKTIAEAKQDPNNLTLTYCPELNIFRLRHYETGGFREKIVTRDQVLSSPLLSLVLDTCEKENNTEHFIILPEVAI